MYSLLKIIKINLISSKYKIHIHWSIFSIPRDLPKQLILKLEEKMATTSGPPKRSDIFTL